MQADNKRKIWQTVLALAAALCVILFFTLFIRGNSKRATEISVESLKDATSQSSKRIDEAMDRAQREIKITASLYEKMLESPTVTTDDLKLLVEESPFDYIDFTDADGTDLDANGGTRDVSSRKYYTDGMAGNSGCCEVISQNADDENIVVFYTPQYYDGEIIGVLLGIYRETQLEDILYGSFFGEDARTYLCNRDGQVIASGRGDYVADSVYSDEVFHSALDKDVLANLEEAVSTGSEYEFQYSGTGGTGNAYVTSLANGNWVLIQTFPSQVTSKFISDANRSGVILLIELVAIFAVCLITVQIFGAIQKKRLIRENLEQSYIVNGITQLFRGFVRVNLEDMTYQYLGGTKPRYGEIPDSGDYEAFKQYLISHVNGEDVKDDLKTLFTKETLQKNMDAETSHLRYEYRNEPNRENWDSNNLICLKRKDGIATEILFTYQDVTKVKEREQKSYEALKEAYQAVESANHAKSNFLSNMSHDIRTPMNAILGMTAIAAMNTDNPERVKDCLNKITISSQHLLGLINEVLDMSKIESGKMVFNEEEFNLSEVVDSVLTIFMPQTQAKNQNLTVKISDISHEEVIGDSMRLRQIIVNILGNAVKFTPNNGNIHFGICEKPSGMHGCGCYEFTFEDDGIGMTEEFIEKVYEPFARADDSRVGNVEGTGLGMSIVKNVVQMMNGEISVESKLGKGTKFVVTVYLQLNGSKRDDVEGLQNLAVLVADDDKFACENACNVLEDIGMIANWVQSGDEAIDELMRARDESRDYSAVILDWKMPGKDGIQTAREIRARVGKDVPIIILSAFDYSSIEQEAREAGVDAFILKPLFRSRLVYVMKTLMLGEHEVKPDPEKLLNKNYSGKRVLLVEDNDLNMEIAEELLKRTGVEVEKAINGKAAVEMVENAPPQYYDIVFMDIQMPVMNGYEATTAIRASEREDLKYLPIVAMSADVFMDDVKHAWNVGMNGHIPKPVEIENLVGVLEKWIG